MLTLPDNIPFSGAVVRIHQERPYQFDEATGLWRFKQVDEDEVVHNLLTNTGRVQLHNYAYGTTSRSNGFNWIGLTNDSGAPAATDTALTAELTGSGLDRIQGTVTLPVGSANQTTIAHTFTFTGGGSQSIQKTALFDAAGPPVAGVMNHEIAFTPRTLFTSDTLTVTFTITLG